MMSNSPADKTSDMSSRMLSFVAICAFLLTGVTACGGPSGKARSYGKPEVQTMISELAKRQSKATSFMAESRMEYWVDGERIKPTVYVMGQRGAKVRFNALNPTGEDVAADLACNGSDFQFVDFNKDCQLTGPCTRDAISQLLRVSLMPDDFLLLAIGSTPIVEAATGTVKWDSKNQHEILTLNSGDGQWKQEIKLDGKDQRWDVLTSTVWNAEGKVEWKLTNKDFKAHKGEDGSSFRLPARTRFEQPQAKAEVTIRWEEREINAELSEDKFEMEIPALPRCGG
jgi:outer membrane lipoprotein-sorting protein